MEESSTRVTPSDEKTSAAEISSLRIFAGTLFIAIFLAGVAVLGKAIEEVTSTVADHGHGRPAGHVCALMLFGAVIASVGVSSLIDLTGYSRRSS